MRNEFMVFLKTGEADFNLLGYGVEEQTLEHNAVTSAKTYVIDINARESTTSYAPRIATPQEAIKGSKIFDYVDELQFNGAVGSDLDTEVILYFPYRDALKGNAKKYDCAIVLSDFGGAGGEELMINFDLALNGDPVLGTAVLAGDNEDRTATFSALV